MDKEDIEVEQEVIEKEGDEDSLNDSHSSMS